MKKNSIYDWFGKEVLIYLSFKSIDVYDLQHHIVD